MSKIALLGPQRLRPTVPSVLDDLEVDGAIATITAGWEEREAEDDRLATALGGRAVNLLLHRRADEVFADDLELRDAHRAMRDRREVLRRLYRIRLTYAMDALRKIDGLDLAPEVLVPERRSALRVLVRLDEHFLRGVRRLRRDFEQNSQPLDRPALARRRSEIQEALAPCSAIAVAGGHVGILLDLLELFGIRDLVEDRTIVAWSAGAMALGTRVVLFHDRPPQGRGAAEALDAGLGLYDGFLPLPHAGRRLDLEDKKRVAIFADRFAPLLCAAMDEGAQVVFADGRIRHAEGARGLTAEGDVVEIDPPFPSDSALCR
jgi:hypothetical protein